MENDKHCAGCIYYRLIYSPPERCCYYLLDTGRKRPCGPGKDCTVKDTTKTRKRKGYTYAAK